MNEGVLTVATLNEAYAKVMAHPVAQLPRFACCTHVDSLSLAEKRNIILVPLCEVVKVTDLIRQEWNKWPTILLPMPYVEDKCDCVAWAKKMFTNT